MKNKKKLTTVKVGRCPRCNALTFFKRVKIDDGRVLYYFCSTCGYWYKVYNDEN